METSVHLPHYRIFFGVLLFALVQPLQAATLGLTPSFPDFFVTYNNNVDDIKYDANCDGTFAGDCVAGQGKLTISGLVSSYTEDPGGSILNAQVTAGVFSQTGSKQPNGRGDGDPYITRTRSRPVCGQDLGAKIACTQGGSTDRQNHAATAKCDSPEVR